MRVIYIGVYVYSSYTHNAVRSYIYISYQCRPPEELYEIRMLNCMTKEPTGYK